MNDLTLLAVLGILEDRPEEVRRQIREANFPLAGPLAIRIEAALEKQKAVSVREAIRKVLKATLKVEPPTGMGDAQKEAFLRGVSEVEEYLADVAARCQETIEECDRIRTQSTWKGQQDASSS